MHTLEEEEETEESETSEESEDEEEKLKRLFANTQKEVAKIELKAPGLEMGLLGLAESKALKGDEKNKKDEGKKGDDEKPTTNEQKNEKSEETPKKDKKKKKRDKKNEKGQFKRHFKILNVFESQFVALPCHAISHFAWLEIYDVPEEFHKFQMYSTSKVLDICFMLVSLAHTGISELTSISSPISIYH